MKNQKDILRKLNINKLNQMQVEAFDIITAHDEVILLSPTGTGKTLAFVLPLLSNIDRALNKIQVLIVAPSRELAIQIEEVIRTMGSGIKVNAFYGGRNISKDITNLNHPPTILVGTPGRIADHLRRQSFDTTSIHSVILDEFDKSLEIGFEDEMSEIFQLLPHVSKKILTSATPAISIPKFIHLIRPQTLDFLNSKDNQLSIKIIPSENKDKLESLVHLLGYIKEGRGIIFCNFKDTIQFVSDYLSSKNIDHIGFYGGLEQRERERALIQFRNGSHRFLLATDLAARGIDVPELDFIIHYQLPLRESEFVHRNGRTARMNSSGTAFVLKWIKQELPEFITGEELYLSDSSLPKESKWTTLFISGGRKDKISKSDIAGLFFKKGKLEKDELGLIEVKQDCAFVAVDKHKSQRVIQLLDNGRIKKRKVRITPI